MPEEFAGFSKLTPPGLGGVNLASHCARFKAAPESNFLSDHRKGGGSGSLSTSKLQKVSYSPLQAFHDNRVQSLGALSPPC